MLPPHGRRPRSSSRPFSSHPFSSHPPRASPHRHNGHPNRLPISTGRGNRIPCLRLVNNTPEMLNPPAGNPLAMLIPHRPLLRRLRKSGPLPPIGLLPRLPSSRLAPSPPRPRGHLNRLPNRARPNHGSRPLLPRRSVRSPCLPRRPDRPRNRPRNRPKNQLKNRPRNRPRSPGQSLGSLRNRHGGNPRNRNRHPPIRPPQSHGPGQISPVRPKPDQPVPAAGTSVYGFLPGNSVCDSA